MANRLRIYLAGPIRGCNEVQKTWWRNEVKECLGREFDFEDPSQWPDDGAMPLEIPKLEACDIVLANMWKESIGTTVGIVRASQQGKPVVLIDPNRADNAILKGLVAPEEPVHTLEEACSRLTELAAEFRPFTVVKKDGSEQPFSAARVARSVSLAAAAAGVTDAGLEERITAPVIARLRREGGQRGSVTTEEIRGQIFDRLEWMHGDTSFPHDVRARAASVLAAWQEKETLKKGEEAIRAAEERVRAAEQEAESWKKLFLDLKDKGIPLPESATTPREKQGPQFKSVDQVLTRISKQWGAFLVLHDEAKASACRIKPSLTAQGREDLFALLESLGAFARDRAFAEASDRPLPAFHARFTAEQYAEGESGETKERYRQKPLEFEGKKCFGLRHLKMTTDTGQKIRVYFDELSSKRFLVCEIGHRKTFKYDG